MNLNGIGRGWVSDALWFQVKDGITKPTIYANCSGSANLAEIRVDIRSESMLLYRESTYVMNGGFKINTVIDPSEIEEFGEFSIWLGCSRGVINE